MTASALIPSTRRPDRLADASDAIEPGQYWRLTEAQPAELSNYAQHGPLPGGLVLLVTRVERVLEGHLHSVMLAPHPEWPEDSPGPRLTIDRFLRVWVLASDGSERRAAEVAALSEAMRRTQAELVEGPSHAAFPQQLPAPASAAGQALATPESVASLQAYALQETERANAVVQWVEEHTATLSEQSAALGRHYAERAQALVVQAKARLGELSRLFEMVKSLKIYTGDDVEVQALVAGEPAAPETPITFFQEVLAFDEELLLHLDADGVDHRHVDDVAQALRDQKLRERMIPSERGAVLVRFSARHRLYARGGGIESAIYNAAMNDEAQRTRLLYRDGSALWLIECDPILKGISQLMPSTAEQSAYFARSAGEVLRPEHLGFAAAQRKQLAALSEYARVLILFWGLRDRTSVLSATSIPVGVNWLDPGMQSQYLRLLSMDSLLASEAETPYAFVRRHSAWVSAGVTVAIDVRRVNSETCPGMFCSGHQWVYPSSKVAVGVVHASGYDLYIEVPGGAPVRRYRCFLSIGGRKVLEDAAVVVIDRTSSGEVKTFLESRRARESYAFWAATFKAALQALVERERALQSAVRSAGAGHLDVSAVGIAQLWMAGVPTARIGAVAARRTSAKALAWLEQMMAPDAIASARKAGEAYARTTGRVPLRLVVSSAGTWRLYCTLAPNERDARLAARCRWVVRVDFGTVIREDRPGDCSFVLLAPSPDEAVVVEWPDCADWGAAASALDGTSMGYRRRIDLLNVASQPSEWAQAWFRGSASEREALAEALVAGSLAFSRAAKGRSVRWPDVLVPVGSGIAYDVSVFIRDRASGPPEIAVTETHEVVLFMTATPWFVAGGVVQDRAAMVERFLRPYAHPEHARAEMNAPVKEPWQLLNGPLRSFEKFQARDARLGPALGSTRGLGVAFVGQPPTSVEAVRSAFRGQYRGRGVRITALSKDVEAFWPEVWALWPGAHAQGAVAEGEGSVNPRVAP